MAYEWDWAEAENSFKQAIALDPKSAQFHAAYAFFLRMMGRLDEAHREQESADRLGSSIGEVTMGRVAQLVVEHQYDKAVEQSRQFLIHETNRITGYYTLGWTYARVGRYADAVATIQELRSMVFLNDLIDRVTIADTFTGAV
ncbi:MAG: hypothetical protein DME26_03420 [Verrucomicrobia bacterium]|nr:MAG: hypothetical protein DME26_03420 [Verrucomicrobiota bacterium]